MNKPDILLNNEFGVFSFRIAGVLIREGKVLLQQTMDDPGYTYPGGHVAFGEPSEQTLVREFKEEVGFDIRPVRLIWVGENFFPWGERDCHQIGLYYLCELADPSQVDNDEPFYAYDEIGGKRIDLQFSWVPVNDLEGVVIYPTNTIELLKNISGEVEHFVYVEDARPNAKSS